MQSLHFNDALIFIFCESILQIPYLSFSYIMWLLAFAACAYILLFLIVRSVALTSRIFLIVLVNPSFEMRMNRTIEIILIKKKFKCIFRFKLTSYNNWILHFFMTHSNFIYIKKLLKISSIILYFGTASNQNTIKAFLSKMVQKALWSCSK